MINNAEFFWCVYGFLLLSLIYGGFAGNSNVAVVRDTMTENASSSSSSSSTLVVPLVTVVQAAVEPDGVLLQDFV